MDGSFLIEGRDSRKKDNVVLGAGRRKQAPGIIVWVIEKMGRHSESIESLN
jgi:hypothetical protein